MQITWYGHSCFLIKNSIGKKILTNPFDDLLGYKHDLPKCDLLLESHPHFDNLHFNKSNLNTKIINTPGYFDLTYTKIQGFNSFHDKCQGFKRGYNIIYSIFIDSLTLCYLGDLGYIPPSSLLDKLSNVDILFVPIGGQFTLDGKSAVKLCNILCPKIIIPMHYKTNKTKFPLDSCKDFIIGLDNIQKIKSNTVDLNNITYDKKKLLLLNSPLV